MPAAAFQAPLARTSIVGFGKEVTEGTAVAATFFQPVDTPKVEDIRGYDDDVSMVGNAAKTQGIIPTVNESNVQYDGKFYYENFGNFLVAAGFGDNIASQRVTAANGNTTNNQPTITSASAAFTQGDVGSNITGTGIPALTTILSVQSATAATMSANATATSATVVFTIGGAVGTTRHRHLLLSTEPVTYTATDFNSFNTRQWAGQQLDQIDITIDSKAAVKFVTMWKGMPSATTSKPTAVYPASAAASGYQATYTLNGANEQRVLSCGLTIKRNVDVVHASTGNQAPASTMAGECEVTGKLKLVYVDDTELLYLLNNTQPTFVITLTSPNGTPAPVITMTMTQCAFKKGPLDRTGKYPTIDFDFEGVYNATDGGPAQFLIVNGVSTAY